MEAKYLGEREKVIAVERLRANQMGVFASREWRWDHVWETWCWFVAIVPPSIASGGIGTIAQNTGGDTKKKCTSVMVFIGMCTGNVIGPLLYDESQAPLYRSGLISNLIMFAVVGRVSAIIPFYLMYLNHRHAKRREELGKSAVMVDESMMGKNQMEDSKAVGIEEGAEGANRRKALEEDNAL
ncbi:hypothetical protein C8A00DRAFT_32406 [Chaetomidium leptoderma]|uniref:MFS general substrate transporter n=1 Tax=Chaetomidium leptoderma TaxID=669021 RepID=A0AAN6VP37_9PEZI|nr:hypothetical protein C8A00DRAFT_32406 [Chaetomidium leptoderma]